MKLYEIWKDIKEESNQSNINNDNFKKWFGNSKVVDKSNNPMICYHGTPDGTFTEFKPKTGAKGKARQQADIGSHFSVDKEYSKRYAGNKKLSKVYEVFLKMENPLYTNTMIWKEDDSAIFKLYIEFAQKLYKRNFKRFFDRGEYYYNKQGDKQQEIQSIMFNQFIIDEVSPSALYQELLNSGFDGMFHEPYNKTGLNSMNKHPKAYIVLKPNQIKAVDNDGTWDINDDNIYS